MAIQVVDVLVDNFGLPEWLPAFALALLVIGLPIVLATAIVQEGGPSLGRADPTLLPAGEPAGRGPTGPRRLLTWRNAILGGVFAFALWGVVATALLVFGKGGEQAAADTDRKSVAVLPFANIGGIPENEYFSDGITGEIIVHLSKIADLKVISRTSVMEYKNTTKKIGEIADELGVATVLEGELQRAGDRIRINAQLIDAEDEGHLWSEQYDRELTDVFAIQADVAQQIAAALKATLTPAENLRLQQKPTENLEAYGYYLRGLDYFYEAVWGEQALRFAIQMYEKAIELDPEFALAFARLAEVHSGMYWWYFDRSEERLANAKAAVDRALELDPDLPEAHAALGWYYYWGFLDYERALEHFAIAETDRPNDAQLYVGIGSVRRRQGELEQATLNFAKAVKLDPRSAGPAANLGETYGLRREFTQAERYLDRAISLQPDESNIYGGKALSRLRGQGSSDGARAVLDQALEILPHTENSKFRLMTVLVELSERNYDDALDRLAAAPLQAFNTQFYFLPKALLYAQIYGLMNERDLELAYYDSARAALQAELQERPGDARLHSALGIAYAGLERTDDAIREGELGVELLPVTVEAWRGAFRVEDLARIYTMVGEYNKAIEQLEYLLSIPGEISAAWLRIDPTWDPLRSHPRFQALLEKYDAEQ